MRIYPDITRRPRQGLLALTLALLLAAAACDEPERLPDGDVRQIPADPAPTIAVAPAPAPPRPSPTARAPAAPLQPTPAPADFQIGPLIASSLGGSSKFEEFSISARITNAGGSGGEFPVRVTASQDGAEPETILTIDRADPGQEFDAEVGYQLAPRNHVVEFAVGEARRFLEVEVASANVAIKLLPYRVVGEEAVEVRLEATNSGQIPASDIRVSGFWGPAPRRYDGINFFSAFIAELAPAERKLVTIPMRMPAGRFRFEIAASHRGPEGDPDDNLIDSWQQVRFDSVQVRLRHLRPPEVLVADTNPAVNFTFVVINDGNEPFETVLVGLVRKALLDRLGGDAEAVQILPQCDDGSTNACWWDVGALSLPAGGRHVAAKQIQFNDEPEPLVGFVAIPDEIAPTSVADLLQIDQIPPMQTDTGADAESGAGAGQGSDPTAGPLSRPLEPLGLDDFYAKVHVDGGIVVASSANVPDRALIRAGLVANEMLAFNADVRRALGDSFIAVIGDEENLTDVPEYRHLRDDPNQNWDQRARGLGGSDFYKLTSTSEENVLCYPGDGYEGQDLLVHEFAHTVWGLGILRLPDGPVFAERLSSAYQNAMSTGLWRRTYAATNEDEYWATGVQAWFNVQLPPRGDTNEINTRSELVRYDSRLARLVGDVFGPTRLESSCAKLVGENNYHLIEGGFSSAAGERIRGLGVNSYLPDGRPVELGGAVTSTAGEYWARLPEGEYVFAIRDYEAPGACWIGFHGANGWSQSLAETEPLNIPVREGQLIDIVIPDTRDNLCGRVSFLGTKGQLARLSILNRTRAF
ncbi:MAG: hypothetical protein F4X41_05325 [Chloroflexi bacterium]|nr:hypothetical protein [Chloroflexota bacterium]